LHVAVLQVDEDPRLSAPVLIDLQQVLAASVTAIRELSLTAGQFRDQQAKPRQWKAGDVISGQAPGQAGSSSSSSGGHSKGLRWGLWQSMQQQSSCRGAAGADAATVGEKENNHYDQQQQQRQQVRKLVQGRQRQQQQQGPFNIWDHSAGDSGSVVELFPMEIRTWLVTLGHQ
jgi:hypothetical protein